MLVSTFLHIAQTKDRHACYGVQYDVKRRNAHIITRKCQYYGNGTCLESSPCDHQRVNGSTCMSKKAGTKQPKLRRGAWKKALEVWDPRLCPLKLVQAMMLSSVNVSRWKRRPDNALDFG